LGDAKPAWKIFRVIGNYFDLVGYEYTHSEQIRDELKNKLGDVVPANEMALQGPIPIPATRQGLVRISEYHVYAGDSIQRRATALHKTKLANNAACFMNSQLAKQCGLADGDSTVASQNGRQVILPVNIDENIADHCVLIPAGIEQTAAIDNSLTEIELARA